MRGAMLGSPPILGSGLVPKAFPLLKTFLRGKAPHLGNQLHKNWKQRKRCVQGRGQILGIGEAPPMLGYPSTNMGKPQFRAQERKHACLALPTLPKRTAGVLGQANVGGSKNSRGSPCPLSTPRLPLVFAYRPNGEEVCRSRHRARRWEHW